MSFSVYFHCFHQGDSVNFPRTFLEDAFGEYVIARESGWMKLAYPDGARSDLTFDEGDKISGFGVRLPPWNRIFWGSMMDLLQRLPAVLYWSGYGCVVTDPAIIPHLPPEMIQGLGKPVVVSRMEEAWEVMRRG